MDEFTDYPPGEPAWLELKTGEMPDLPDLAGLLARMTLEMQEQFEAFRQMRADAEQILAGSPDDSEARLARADLKAAAEAMSLLIRTLEKIEALQRSIAQAEERAMEERLAEEGYDEAKAQLLALIEARAQSIAAEAIACPSAEQKRARARGSPGSDSEAGPAQAAP